METEFSPRLTAADAMPLSRGVLEQVPVYQQQQQQQQPLYQTVGQPISTETQPTYAQAPTYGYQQQPMYGYPGVGQMPYQYPGAGYAPAAPPAPAAPSSNGPPAAQYTGPGGYSVMPGDDDNISA